jgi:hypothetical protein
MKRIIVALLWAALAGQTWATVGSVISSFWVDNWNPPGYSPLGIYRDDSHVYVTFYYTGGDGGFLRSYTAAGVTAGSFALEGIIQPSDVTPCHLGAGYFGIVDVRTAYLYFVNKTNGSIVSSFRAAGGGGVAGTPAVTWDGLHFYSAGMASRGEFNLYNPDGSLVRSWVLDGWPGEQWGIDGVAFAPRANYRDGRYLVIAPFTGDKPHYLFNMVDGSLLASWRMPSSYFEYSTDAAYGSAFPATYGGAAWILRMYVGGVYWAYQLDIHARPGTSVLPASVGKVKAIYR